MKLVLMKTRGLLTISRNESKPTFGSNYVVTNTKTGAVEYFTRYKSANKWMKEQPESKTS